METHGALPRVVIVGAGFGGLRAAQALGKARARITVVDRSNFHLFQPLLYQVATAGLSPADIAAPIRSVLRHQANTEILMAEVGGVDVARKTVRLPDRDLPYDYLVLATGARHSYFGRDEWEPFAPGLKSVEDATTIRRRILLAFEAAEMEPDPERQRELLSFVLVGAGPTGVEMAGAIAELAHAALASDFRHIDPRLAQVTLVEAGPRILAGFPPALSEKAAAALQRLGVEVRTGSRVEKVDAEGVDISGRRLRSRTVIWTAGVVASRAGAWLGAETDRAGRVKVAADLSVPGHPDVFVIGDTAAVAAGTAAGAEPRYLPGVAPVAMQQGRYVGDAIRLRIERGADAAIRPFHYVDKGNLATIGRSSAIADLGRVRLSGFIAWLAWLAIHIFYLIGFRNRLLVLIQWAWAYCTFQRGARLITAGDGRK